MLSPLYAAHESSNVPINPALKCGEEWLQDIDDYEEDDYRVGTIDFHITLPRTIPSSETLYYTRLNFNCRDRSAGVLLPSEPAAPSASQDGRVDPFFFEKGFDLEAMTGFQVWPGSRLMVESFTCANDLTMDENNKCTRVARLRDWKDRLAKGGMNILEVGAGIGVVGTCLAAAGGNVLVTDLPVLVEHGIQPNLRRNSTTLPAPSMSECPEFLATKEDESQFNANAIGEGWARAGVLDWFKPVSKQLSAETSSNIDVIIACDCIFLRKLVDPLFATVSTLFEHSMSRCPKFLFTFQRRNMMGVFIQLEELLGRIDERGWMVECLAWRTVHVEGDGIHENYLFEVSRGIE